MKNHNTVCQYPEDTISILSVKYLFQQYLQAPFPRNIVVKNMNEIQLPKEQTNKKRHLYLQHT